MLAQIKATVFCQKYSTCYIYSTRHIERKRGSDDSLGYERL